MRRKEQEARIEQQKQEKERAREDAARERARSVPPGSVGINYLFCTVKWAPQCASSEIDYPPLIRRIFFSLFQSVVLSTETERSVWLPSALLNKRPWRNCRRRSR